MSVSLDDENPMGAWGLRRRRMDGWEERRRVGVKKMVTKIASKKRADLAEVCGGRKSKAEPRKREGRGRGGQRQRQFSLEQAASQRGNESQRLASSPLTGRARTGTCCRWRVSVQGSWSTEEVPWVVPRSAGPR